MKFLLVVLAFVILAFLLRNSWRSRGGGTPRREKPPAAPREMLSCAHCGLHLPRDEALPGRGGVFCSEAHRSAYERAHPPA
jgi:uncharacterized protein